MTRFLYIADSHLGARPMGYQKQPGYPDRLPEIVAALSRFIYKDGGIDFVLHGGDMIDSASDSNIRAANLTFDLPVPLYLCLGNHDLTETDACERWLTLAPRFFPDGSSDFTLERPDCRIHVVPNQWCEQPYYWTREQNEHFTTKQHSYLERAMGRDYDRPHILVTHSPALGLPPEQTGLPTPLHAPGSHFESEILALGRNTPHLRCILGAHSHMNMHVSLNGTEFVTVSALVETPFEFKLFEVNSEHIDMRTVSLAADIPFEPEYDKEKTFVQGRPCDRTLSLSNESRRDDATPEEERR